MDALLPLQVLPLALGAALSPAVFTVQMLVLSSGPGALRRAWALALGRMVALAAVSVGGVSLLAHLPDFRTGQPSWPEAAIVAVAGVVLLAVAWREARAHQAASDRASRWSRGFADLPPAALFAFGAGWMLVNVSTLALYLPALHLITSSAAAVGVQALALAELFVLTSAVVLVPVLAVTLGGDRVRPWLDRVHDWVQRESRHITVWVCALLGIGLLGWAAFVVVALLR